MNYEYAYLRLHARIEGLAQALLAREASGELLIVQAQLLLALLEAEEIAYDKPPTE